MAWWDKSNSEPRDLTEAEFAELTGRIVDVAVKGTTLSDAITATAKALGSLIGVASKRPEISFESMLQAANEAGRVVCKGGGRGGSKWCRVDRQEASEGNIVIYRHHHHRF